MITRQKTERNVFGSRLRIMVKKVYSRGLVRGGPLYSKRIIKVILCDDGIKFE